MKIYKERQFLIFEFEDGKTVKYDFATKTTIGKKGKPVQNLCSQLKDISMDDVINCCVDEKYANFLAFVRKRYCDRYGRHISNVGTILDKVPYYAKYEQFFSAGVEDILDYNFDYTINDIPKGLIKLCRSHNIKLSNDFLKFYKQNPDGYLLAYNLNYISLEDNDLYNILTSYDYEYRYYNRKSVFCILLNDYGYTAKGLLNYIDYCKTYEAIENMGYLMKELLDYAKMMKQISGKFDKYPRHFLTTHKIACRNYNRLKKEFNEEWFERRIDLNMEKTFGDYKFIYPKCTQDIKDEAVSQNNCVASYIDKVIEGNCHILFLRKKDSPDKSLVTIEVCNGKIVQARQRFNYPITSEQQEVVDKWDKWWANKINNNANKESEELKYVS